MNPIEQVGYDKAVKKAVRLLKGLMLKYEMPTPAAWHLITEFRETLKKK